MFFVRASVCVCLFMCGACVCEYARVCVRVRVCVYKRIAPSKCYTYVTNTYIFVYR